MATEQRKIYIGNLNYDAREDELKEFLADAGCPPVRVQIPVDKTTRKSRGFGFAEFETADAAREAIGQLNDQRFMGRLLKVSLAQERADNSNGPNGFRGTGGSHYRRHEPRW